MTLNIWSPEPYGRVIQHIAFHATETRNQGLLNANCRWLCVALDMDDLFLGVDCIARWALCHTCANSESTLASTAESYSFTCDWEHSRLSGESRSTIYHNFSGFPNERSRTSSVLLRWGRVQHGPILNWAWFLFDSLEKTRSLVSQTVRIAVSHWCFLRLQSTFFPSMAWLDLEYDFWPFEYCWMLQSVLECVALSLPSLSRSNQSSIALICALVCEVLFDFRGGWPLGGSIPR